MLPVHLSLTGCHLYRPFPSLSNITVRRTGLARLPTAAIFYAASELNWHDNGVICIRTLQATMYIFPILNGSPLIKLHWLLRGLLVPSSNICLCTVRGLTLSKCFIDARCQYLRPLALLRHVQLQQGGEVMHASHAKTLPFIA